MTQASLTPMISRASQYSGAPNEEPVWEQKDERKHIEIYNLSTLTSTQILTLVSMWLKKRGVVSSLACRCWKFFFFDRVLTDIKGIKKNR